MMYACRAKMPPRNGIVVVALVVAACGTPSSRVGAPTEAVSSAWVELGPDGVAIARAITSATVCPAIAIDGTAASMQVRVGASTVAQRPTISTPADGRPLRDR